MFITALQFCADTSQLPTSCMTHIVTCYILGEFIRVVFFHDQFRLQLASSQAESHPPRQTTSGTQESRLKVKTFADMKKPVIGKAKEKLIVDSEVLFRRLLVVSKQREVNLEDVLTHELSAISPSLFHDDGTMRKTTKSDLEKT